MSNENKTTAKLGQIGKERTFSFSNDDFEIVEVLDNPGIKMWWNWDSGICPHCKEKITRNIEHTFYRIEVLKKVGIENKDATEDDIVLLGNTLDNRTMIISKEKYNDAFEKTKNFKKLVK